MREAARDAAVVCVAFLLRAASRAMDLAVIFADETLWREDASECEGRFGRCVFAICNVAYPALRSVWVLPEVMAVRARVATTFVFASACLRTAAIAATLLAESSYVVWICDSLCFYEALCAVVLLDLCQRAGLWISATNWSVAVNSGLDSDNYDARFVCVALLACAGSTGVFAALLMTYAQSGPTVGHRFAPMSSSFEIIACAAVCARVATCTPKWSSSKALEFDRMRRIFLLRAFLSGAIASLNFSQAVRNFDDARWSASFAVAFALLETVLAARLGQAFYWNTNTSTATDDNYQAVRGIKEIISTMANVSIVVAALVQVAFFDQYLHIWLYGTTAQASALSIGVLCACLSQWVQPRDAWRRLRAEPEREATSNSNATRLLRERNATPST